MSALLSSRLHSARDPAGRLIQGWVVERFRRTILPNRRAILPDRGTIGRFWAEIPKTPYGSRKDPYGLIGDRDNRLTIHMDLRAIGANRERSAWIVRRSG